MAASLIQAGLSSQIDWKTMVTDLINVERQGVTKMEGKQQAELDKQAALTTLRDSVKTYQDASDLLSNNNSFFTYATSLGSNTSTVPESLVGITTSDAAMPGSHTIIVENLATAQRTTSSAAVKDSTGTAITSSTQSLGLSGTFSIQGQIVTVAMSDTLSDVVGKINSLNSGSSPTLVTASLLNVGGSSAADFRLVLNSDETGAAGFTLSGTDLTGGLANLNLGGGGSTTAGVDAVLTVDGFTASRASNVVSDMIPGVTLNLYRAEPATTMTLTTGYDVATLKSNLQAFVDTYNATMTFIAQQNAFDAKSGKSGLLMGDFTMNSVQSQMSSGLLKPVQGLPSDRNSLVMIGLEPDRYGQLSINQTTLDKWINTDITAIRDVFTANMVSDNSAIDYVYSDITTQPGSYLLNVTTAPEQAKVVGSVDLSAGLASNDVLTLTTGTGDVATVNLTAGQTLSQLIASLNTEFSSTKTETWKSTALLDGGLPATSSTKLANLGLVNNDVITITGTDRLGNAVSSDFTVLDAANDSIATLLSSVQNAYGGNVSASINANGEIEIVDNVTGLSSLSFGLSGALTAPGSVVQEGRFSLPAIASANGNFLQINNKEYGASSFTISQSSNALLGAAANSTFTGVDIVGTIGGQPTTGRGNLLEATAGDPLGLVVTYSGTATGAVGNATFLLGVGAQNSRTLDAYTSIFSGSLKSAIESSDAIYQGLQTDIDELNRVLAEKEQTLLKRFQAMESVVAKNNSVGDYLTGQISQFNKTSG
ncbi:MAG: flagellar filament capping protein FliD [Zetaproteobacteria bacterium]|nr:flagellar filament capping protein FliD [Zetaproteobacteria bacterium]